MSIKPPPASFNSGTKNTNYFEEKKKGEMNELKNALNTVINQNDSKKGRQVIRKVIGYMTLGMDASPVFSEMCRASFTNDQVMKKMIYFYLTTYAEDNSDLAIMAVNTFKKDCKHTSSKIRGLALRNLCSFKSTDYVNNVLPVIRELLTDYQAYVKKTAIMGLLKVFYVQPTMIIQDETLINTLSLLIKDSDSLVSINALLALDEILISQGGIPINMKLYLYLMRRLKQYNQWQQTCILDILYRYQFQSQNDRERYEVLGILWEKLKHSSTPLVLGSIKIILKLTDKKEDLFKNIVQKIKAPLLTLMSGNQNSGSYETMYIVLQHIQYVIVHMAGKQYFEKDFKYFYSKVDQPTYIKSLKVKILGQLANQYNLGDLLNQLNDYATDVDIEMARKSVKILTEIAIRLPQVSKALLINLNSYYKMDKVHLSNQSILSFQLILRKYPKLFNQVSKNILQYRSSINEIQSTKAFIWILGAFSQQIEESPYVLEQYIQNQQQFYVLQTSVKQVLLTSILQTFLKRPVQTQKILSNIFKLIFQSQKSSMALLDHAAFYYLALQDNIDQVKKSFASFQSDMTKYKQELPQAILDEDFNSLGIVYKQKQGKYTKPYEYFIAMRNKQLGLIQNEVEVNSESEQGLNENQNQQEVQNNQIDSIEAENLQQNVILSSQQFEQIWQSLQQGSALTYTLINHENVSEESIEELFKLWHINTMASSQEDQGNVLKFYLYSKDNRNQDYYCFELYINKQQANLAISIKSKSQKAGAIITAYISQFLRLNELIQ